MRRKPETPMTMPPTISPRTAGWPIRSASSPKSFAAAKIARSARSRPEIVMTNAHLDRTAARPFAAPARRVRLAPDLSERNRRARRSIAQQRGTVFRRNSWAMICSKCKRRFQTIMSDTREKVAAGLDAAATVIERLGLLDMVVPPIRSRLERIDTEEVLDNALAAVRRTPEILVVLLG